MPAAGKLFRVSERTIRNWEAGRVGIPYAAFKLMRILRGYELPGGHWKGYRLIGDTLWSPEGKAFKAADGRWWSLTVAMAHEFRRMMRRAAGQAPVPGAPASAPAGAPEPEVLGLGSTGLVYSSTSQTEISESPENKGCRLTGPRPVVDLAVAA